MDCVYSPSSRHSSFTSRFACDQLPDDPQHADGQIRQSDDGGPLHPSVELLPFHDHRVLPGSERCQASYVDKDTEIARGPRPDDIPSPPRCAGNFVTISLTYTPVPWPLPPVRGSERMRSCHRDITLALFASFTNTESFRVSRRWDLAPPVLLLLQIEHELDARPIVLARTREVVVSRLKMLPDHMSGNDRAQLVRHARTEQIPPRGPGSARE